MGVSGDEPITVVVGDDHPLMREAVARTLSTSPALTVVAQADSTRTVLTAIREHEPKVAVVDLRLGDGDAFEVLATARDEHLRARFLLVSSFGEPALVHKALQGGASGYLTKGADAQTLVSAVRGVAAGQTVVGADLQSALLAEIGRRDPATQADSAVLSARELAALQLVAAGRKEREIATALAVSGSSVKSYLRRAYEKLGANDRSSAVAEAVRRGLID